MSDRRSDKRLAVEVEIGFYSASNFFSGLSGDFSEGGLFIATYQLLPVGTQVRAEFALPEGDEISLDATVVWVRSPLPEGAAPGMGIRFDVVSAAAEAQIRRFMHHRPPFMLDD